MLDFKKRFKGLQLLKSNIEKIEKENNIKIKTGDFLIIYTNKADYYLQNSSDIIYLLEKKQDYSITLTNNSDETNKKFTVIKRRFYKLINNSNGYIVLKKLKSLAIKTKDIDRIEEMKVKYTIDN
jgi:hypothetical protein